jgi:hypothetical protein
VTFFGGAAHGTRLDLANIPVDLRVVVDLFGNVDALDEEGDEPRDGESVHLYRRNQNLGWLHFKESRAWADSYGQESGFVLTADYFPHNAEVWDGDPKAPPSR